MLRFRLLSSLVMAPLAFWAIYAGGYWFQALMVAAACIMAWEWEHLCCKQFSPVGGLLAVGGIGAALFGAFYPSWTFAGIIPFFALLGCAGYKKRFEDLAWLAVGAFYIFLPLLALTWIRLGTKDGLEITLWLFFAVWATDTGAYVCGRALRGPKLAPRLSPNKTWSGLAGGLVWAMMAGGLFAVWSGHSLVGIVGCSLVLSLVSQGGDLWESWVKRHFKVKDSGKLIPGHGGLLDRVDGLMAASLFVAFLCILREENIILW